jgi:hypothetical protein
VVTLGAGKPASSGPAPATVIDASAQFPRNSGAISVYPDFSPLADVLLRRHPGPAPLNRNDVKTLRLLPLRLHIVAVEASGWLRLAGPW